MMRQLQHILFLLWICVSPITAQTATFTSQDISVARYLGNRKAAVSYTFDDGLEEHYTLVFPQLEKRGLKASFCIIGSKVGRDQKGTPCMTWDQLGKMADHGQEITSHGWGHRSVAGLTDEELRHEVQRNDTAIYQHTGIFPRTYFYPGNRKTDIAVAFCSQNRVGTRTRQISIGSKRDTTWLRHWIADLLESGEWGVGMTHGITRGYDAFRDPQTLWSHLDYVVTLQDRLWIGRFCDVAAYIKERDSTKLKIRTGRRHTVIQPSCPLDKQIFTMPLTLTVRTGNQLQAVQDGHQLTVSQKGGLSVFNFNPFGGAIRISLR